MADNDEVTFIGRGGRGRGGQSRSKAAVTAAMQSGASVETTKKYAAGGNRQSQSNVNTLRLDQETEELRHSHVTLDMGKLIQQGRQSKGMTQKELATRINEKQQVINEYECGKAIPNQQIIGKIERALGVKLRGKKPGK